MNINIEAKAPTRIDLLGGTLDLWPIHHLIKEKATINLGVSLYAVSKIETLEQGEEFVLESKDQEARITGTYLEICENSSLPLAAKIFSAFWNENLPPLKITLSAESPKGAGLGGSSSLAISFAAALNKASSILKKQDPLNEHVLVKTVQNIESVLLHSPAGCQDHWGAVRGAVNIINYPYGEIEVQTLSPKIFLERKEEMILYYSGTSRFSGMNNWDLYKKFLDKDDFIVEQFKKIGELAVKGKESILNHDWSSLVGLSREEWVVRKELCPGIETEQTKKIASIAKKAGALFSRVCGAGGGGVMAIFTPKNKKESVCRALQGSGGRVLDYEITAKGLELKYQTD